MYSARYAVRPGKDAEERLRQSKMKIIVICSGTYCYGEETVSLAVMSGLKENGHTVHCLASGWNNGEFPSQLRVREISYTLVRLGKISKILKFPYVWWTLNAIARLPEGILKSLWAIRSVRPDVILCTTFEKGSMLLPFISDTRVVYHVHAVDEKSRHLKRIVLKHGRTALFLAVSKSIADRLEVMGIPSERIRVVHNGVESIPPDALRKHSATDDCLSIGIVGQVGRWKGHEDLFHAISALHKRGANIRLSVFGNGMSKFADELKALAKTLQIESLINWMGFVQNRDEIYSLLDVCVVPTRTAEPFGMVAVEAGIRGIPVVATAVGGLVEIVIDQETGVLIPPSNPSALEHALLELFSNPHLRRSLGNAARARVQRLFSTRQMIEKVEHALLTQIEQNRG
jgi:glycosyltransferase involved in cell wall biosynthesis